MSWDLIRHSIIDVKSFTSMQFILYGFGTVSTKTSIRLNVSNINNFDEIDLGTEYRNIK